MRRVVGSRALLFVVMPRGDARGIRGQRNPVAWRRLTAETDREIAVGIDIEQGIVDHAHGPGAETAIGRAGLDRDRYIYRAVRVAAHRVAVIGTDRGVEIDRIGIVTGELARGRDDTAEIRMRRIALEHPAQAAFEHMHQRTMRTDHIIGAGEIPLRAGPALIDLGQQIDQFAQRFSRFGLDTHAVLPGLFRYASIARSAGVYTLQDVNGSGTRVQDRPRAASGKARIYLPVMRIPVITISILLRACHQPIAPRRNAAPSALP